jgi:phospholipid/cholesterol/gamma-HCH transport system permease protein
LSTALAPARSASCELVGAIATFGAKAVVDAARPPYEAREVLRHAYEFGYRSAPLIITAGVAVGVVLSMHTRASLERFGAEAMIPAALAIALIRETGPLITGLLVAGRVGAGIGAEIGAMKVTEQIDALEATAVDAFKYLAVTRIIALMIAMPLLTIMMDFAGILGGYVAETAVSGMSWQLYLERAFNYVSYPDIILATLRTSCSATSLPSCPAISVSRRAEARKASARRPRAASSWRRSSSF